MNKEKTDQKIAGFLRNLERLEMSEPNKNQLIGEFHTMIDQVLLESNDTDYLLYQSRKRKKNITLATICFVLGLLVAFIPSLMYISSLKNDDTPAYQFVPNAIAERKPIYLQMLKTQEQVDALKKTSIYMKNLISIDAGVGIGMHGLDIYSAKELKNSNYHLKYVGAQEKQKIVIDGYVFVPDTVLNKDPSTVQVLYNEDTVKSAKKMKNLTYKKYLEVGAVIDCPSQGPCTVVSKLKAQKVLVLKPFNYAVAKS